MIELKDNLIKGRINVNFISECHGSQYFNGRNSFSILSDALPKGYTIL